MSRYSIPPSPTMAMYNLIYHNILKKEMDRLSKKGDRLGEQNFALGANSRALSYRSEVHLHSLGSGGPAAIPHDSIKEEVEELIQAKKRFARDRDFIRNTCSVMIPDEYNYQNMRDALSDMIADYIPELKKLPRTREEAYYIKDSKTKYKQWLKARDRIEFYIGNMLVFS